MPGQSPDPENQSAKQQRAPPSDGKGVDQGSDNKEASKAQLDELESNPKHVLDEHRKATTSKTVENNKS